MKNRPENEISTNFLSHANCLRIADLIVSILQFDELNILFWCHTLLVNNPCKSVTNTVINDFLFRKVEIDRVGYVLMHLVALILCPIVWYGWIVVLVCIKTTGWLVYRTHCLSFSVLPLNACTTQPETDDELNLRAWPRSTRTSFMWFLL